MAHYSDLDAGLSGSSYSVPAAPASFATGAYGTFFKRLLDIVLVLLVAPFVLPVVLGLGLLIRRDGGAAFYCQPRIGRGGKVFRLWKLRSMVPDADRRLEAHLRTDPLARAEWDETQKLKEDPRITAAGRLIRKTSLDELPQLWNVLLGDMSLVGPRPMMPQQAELYPGRDYYRLRPGLTGLWQISDRNQTSFAARAAYDAEYSRQMSLVTDVLVLFATVWVVLRGTGY
jgi:lipopolysaccharide/colanic/teichoic acid biosynthesis glycosyltransferase